MMTETHRLGRTVRATGPRALVALGTLCLVEACASGPVRTVRFRTLQPGGAFERAVAAMKIHGGGVRQADRDQGMIRSRWYHTGFNYGFGKQVSYFFIASVVDNPADGSASVTLRTVVLLCGVLDRKMHEDELERRCEPSPVTPQQVQQHSARLGPAFKDDVFRFE